ALAPGRTADRAARAGDERPSGALPRSARRSRRAFLHHAEVPHAHPRRRVATRPVPGRRARASHGSRVHASRTLAEGVAARRDPAAVERPPRRHVVRRPAADPTSLLHRARARAAGVLAATRRSTWTDGARPGAAGLRDLDGREARPRPRVDRGP